MEENIGLYYQQIFKKIFNISAIILEEYQHLKELEKKGQKNSNEYIVHFNRLKTLLSQEQANYEAIKRNGEILNSLLHKIAYFNKNASDFIIPKNNNSLIYARMSLKLNELLTEIGQDKSPDIFILFNKFALFSQLHFENILLTLILLQDFLDTYPNSDLKDVLINITYKYAFMFPYIEDTIFKKSFTIPEELFSIINYFSSTQNISAEEITKHKARKFIQVKKYLSKNNSDATNYLFSLFYLRILSFELNDSIKNDMEEALKSAPFNKEIKGTIKRYLNKENPERLVRQIYFSI